MQKCCKEYAQNQGQNSNSVFSTTTSKPDRYDCDCEAIRRAVWSLRPAERELVVLRYYDDMPYEQIAELLDISIQAVNGRAAARFLRIYAQSVALRAKWNAIRAAVDVYLVKATTGSLPESLPPGLPGDPYSGKPFQYAKTAEGFVLRCQAKDLNRDKVRVYEFNVAQVGSPSYKSMNTSRLRSSAFFVRLFWRDSPRKIDPFASYPQNGRISFEQKGAFRCYIHDYGSIRNAERT